MVMMVLVDRKAGVSESRRLRMKMVVSWSVRVGEWACLFWVVMEVSMLRWWKENLEYGIIAQSDLDVAITALVSLSILFIS